MALVKHFPHFEFEIEALVNDVIHPIGTKGFCEVRVYETARYGVTVITTDPVDSEGLLMSEIQASDGMEFLAKRLLGRGIQWANWVCYTPSHGRIRMTLEGILRRKGAPVLFTVAEDLSWVTFTVNGGNYLIPDFHECYGMEAVEVVIDADFPNWHVLQGHSKYQPRYFIEWGDYGKRAI